MAHKHDINGPDGDILDRVNFCSDYCHRSWCTNQNIDFDGWDGCHELEYDTPCDACGDMIPGGDGSYDELERGDAQDAERWFAGGGALEG